MLFTQMLDSKLLEVKAQTSKLAAQCDKNGLHSNGSQTQLYFRITGSFKTSQYLDHTPNKFNQNLWGWNPAINIF